MYNYVPQKELAPYRTECETLLKKVKDSLVCKGIHVRQYPVGSGPIGFVTRDGKGPFDLDYNLRILPITSPRYLSDASGLRLLKDTIRTTIDKFFNKSALAFSFGDDSTAAITYVCHDRESGDVCVFSLDIGIVMGDGKKDLRRLIHVKKKKPSDVDHYCWNKVRDTRQMMHRFQKICQVKAFKEELRSDYLALKNYHIHDNPHEPPSFIVFIEAVNRVWVHYKGQLEKQAPASRKDGSKMSKHISSNTHTQSQMNHHANQGNPNNGAHRAAMNNHANQCNPNHASKGKG